MHKQRVAQEIGYGQGAVVALVPALMYSVLFYYILLHSFVIYSILFCILYYSSHLAIPTSDCYFAVTRVKIISCD